MQLNNVEYDLPKSKVFNNLRPSTIRSFEAIAIDWILIIISYALFLHYSWLLPISLIVIGSRQRAMSNLVHDASHFNLFPDRSVNDLFTNLFCAIPMFETVAIYRKMHGAHHKYLGTVDDPDSHAHLLYGFDDLNPPKVGFFRKSLCILFHPLSFKHSLIGNLFNNKKDFALISLWWLLVLVSLSFISSILTLKIIAVWFGAKMSSYHTIRLIAEFLDHSGLRVGQVLSFTRNLPRSSFLSKIIHPHKDTFHIVHHLYPKIPHYHLEEAHHLLLEFRLYSTAHHCDGYLTGKHSAVSCWTGKCESQKCNS